jgi:hypothetical protein
LEIEHVLEKEHFWLEILENGPMRDPRLDGGPYFVQSELHRE